MLDICAPVVHRHAPPPPLCQGCGAACGPDDVLHLSSGSVAICPSCWMTWRDGGYARVASGPRKQAKAAVLAALDRSFTDGPPINHACPLGHPASLGCGCGDAAHEGGSL